MENIWKDFAFVENGVVQWTSQIDGLNFTVEQFYPPDVVAKLIEFTDADPRPREGWTFDGKKFAAPIIPIEVRRQAVRDQIENDRTSRLYNGFEHDGGVFPSDRDSIRGFNVSATRIASGINPPATYSVRTVTDGAVEMTSDAFLEMFAALDDHLLDVQRIANDLNDRIDASDDPESVTWPTSAAQQ